MNSLLPVGPQRIGNTLLLNLVFRNTGFGDHTLDALLAVFIRKVDIAAEEYQRAHDLFSEHGKRSADDGSVVFSLPVAGEKLELCILTLTRALRALERLRSSARVALMPSLTRERIEHAAKDLKDIRNVIEHIDGRIVKEGLERGETHTLAISADGTLASIGGESIKLDDLHRCLLLCMGVAESLAGARFDRPPDAAVPDSP